MKTFSRVSRFSSKKGSTGSASTNSLSAGSNFLAVTKMKLFLFFQRMMASDWKGLKYFLLILEILGVIQFLLYFAFHCFSWEEMVGDFGQQIKYFFGLVLPATSTGDLLSYSIVFGISACYVAILLILSVGMIYFPQVGDGLYSLSFFLFRVTRTLLLIPLVDTFMKPFQCQFFDGTFKWHVFGEGAEFTCVEFPYVLYLIFGTVFFVFVLIVVYCDLLFLNDKLFGKNYFTAKSDGRFCSVHITVMISILISHILLDSVGEANSYLNIAVVIYCIGNYLWFLRVVPYFSRLYSFIYVFQINVIFVFNFAGMIIELYDFSLYRLLSLLAVLITVSISFSLLFLRYYLIFVLFRKGINKNFLCSSSHDVSLIIYLTKKKKDTIFGIIKNPKFSKSKKIVHDMLAFFSTDVQFSNALLTHGDSITEKTFFDTEFYIFAYRHKVSDNQIMGTNHSVEFVKGFKKVRSHEKRLRKNYKKLFSVLLEEGYSSNVLSVLLSSIQHHLLKCEGLYMNLLKKFPGENVYRRLSQFLLQYKNDVEGSLFFAQEADSLKEFGNASGNSATSFGVLSEKSSGTDIDKLEKSGSMSNLSDKSKGSTSIFSQGIKKSTVKSSEISEFNQLQGKLRQTRYFVFFVVWFLVIGMFVLLVSGMIALFAVAQSNSSNIIHTNSVVKKMNHVKKDFASAALFARKLFNTFGSVYTIEEDRNRTYFSEMLEHTCHDLRDQLITIYLGIEEEYHEPFERFIEVMQSLNGQLYPVELSFYDATMLFSELCLTLLDEYETAFMDNSSFDQSYFFLQHNQEELYIQASIAADLVLEHEREEFIIVQYMSFIFPCSALAIFVIVGGYLLIVGKQKKLYEGFSLIPKEHLLKKFEVFGGDAENNQVRLVTNDSPVAFRFCSISIGVMIIASCIFAVFSVLIYLTNSYVIDNNQNLNYVSDFESGSRKLHLAIVDLLFGSNSIADEEERIFQVEEHIEEFLDFFALVKHGKNADGGIGADPYGRVFIFEDLCHEERGSTLVEKLNCMSYNNLGVLFAHNANNLLNLYANGTSLNILKDSKEYETILLLDEGNSSLMTYESQEYIELGILESASDALADFSSIQADTFNSITTNSSIVLLSIGIPLICFVFILLFISYPQLINQNLLLVKGIFLLFPRKFVLQRHVFKYLMGDDLFSKVFLRDKKKQTRVFFDMMKMSSLPFVCFDKAFRFVEFNHAAEDLFSLSQLQSKNLKMILSKSSINSIRSWMKRKIAKSFTGECTGTVNEVEVKLQVDICRNDELCICFLENIESAKRKKILELAEKKSEKTNELLENIIPKQIAKVMKLEEKHSIVNTHKQCTAVFIDIVDFSRFAAGVDAVFLVSTLNEFFGLIDDLIGVYQMEKIKTIGDCYFAVSGIPNYSPKHAENALEFCIATLQKIDEFNVKRRQQEAFEFQVRIGMSSGSVVAGIIGKRKWCYDCWGTTINEASRMESFGLKGQIQLSRSAYEYLYDEYTFMERVINVKSVGCVKTYILRREEMLQKDSGEFKTIKCEEEKELKMDEKPVKGKVKVSSLVIEKSEKKSNIELGVDEDKPAKKKSDS